MILPKHGDALPCGHHLVYFNPRTPESQLRLDGTDAIFCPPAPFTRRMWAGGVMKWGHQPLLLGNLATSTITVSLVEKKGFETQRPMVFVKQRISIAADGAVLPSIEEERTHVYLAPSVKTRAITEGKLWITTYHCQR